MPGFKLFIVFRLTEQYVYPKFCFSALNINFGLQKNCLWYEGQMKTNN